MHILGIWLQSFRNYHDTAIQFGSPITVLVGENGVGKTSILEGICLASTGESFRATVIEHMILFDQEFGRVQVKLDENLHIIAGSGSSKWEESDTSTIEVLVTNGQVQGKKTHKRVFSLNGARKVRKDIVGVCKTVLFRPEDLRLIEGSPSRRRQFLDTPLGMDSWQYTYALRTYEQALRRRNKVLEQVREGETSKASLAYWDSLLIEHGEFVQKRRAEYVMALSKVPFSRNFTIEYVPSLISRERLDKYENKSIAAGHTLIGPHKDDFRIELDSRDVSAYGSRGQQRLAVLWLKIGERAFLSSGHSSASADFPILLLDDIFSELDESAQELVFEIMTQGQTIITTADAKIATLIETHFENKNKNKNESKTVQIVQLS